MSNISKVFSAELDGIDARLIEVETDVNVGLHSFTIVGLADKALSEAKERVNSALKNIGVKPPTKENRKIVVNLAPADVKKTGSQYDLAIAVGYLLATEQIKRFDASSAVFAGELALEGKLRPISGALSIAYAAKRAGISNLFVPAKNAAEAAMVKNLKVFPVTDLHELINHLEDRSAIGSQPHTEIKTEAAGPFVDISEIKGQGHAKRALTIAAAGGHNLLMQGPPGTGKTMLAQALASILPPPTLDEIIEMTKIWSAAGMLGGHSSLNFRPFRAPHHTASAPAIVGGGGSPRPGEISLAHRGVLFLDELPEFHRDILESLRQPIESGTATIARAKNTITLPAKFVLVAAMNPCPCGYYGDDEKACRCGAFEVLRYQKKISGPLLDRIDLHVNVPRVAVSDLREKKRDERERDAVRNQVARARNIQAERLKNLEGKHSNAELSSKECEDMIRLSPGAENFLKETLSRSLISGRGYYRLLKVAQTVADLEAAQKVTESHLAEAFSYRLREEN